MEIPSTVDLGDKQVNVLYRLGRLKSGWQIYDVVAEDISVVSNYRQQIDDHFRRGDAEGLVAKLKELLTKETIDEDIAI
jgi:ABC-type transporter MlaC component